MRGTDQQPGTLFSYVDLESRVRSDHPLRSIRAIVNDALVTLAPNFVSLYSKIGRPSIAPERLLRAMLLQAFYSVRSERQLASLFQAFLRPNRALAFSLPAVAAMLAATLLWPAARDLFRFGPLHLDDLSLTVGVGIVVLVTLELLKWLWRRATRKEGPAP